MSENATAGGEELSAIKRGLSAVRGLTAATSRAAAGTTARAGVAVLVHHLQHREPPAGLGCCPAKLARLTRPSSLRSMRPMEILS